MRKLAISILILFSVFSFLSSACAISDYSCSLPNWDVYYFQYGLIGYPVYNTRMERYDFFDIEESYCGSLNFNPLLDEWEYFGI